VISTEDKSTLLKAKIAQENRLFSNSYPVILMLPTMISVLQLMAKSSRQSFTKRMTAKVIRFL
jgi:hypothetical protein